MAYGCELTPVRLLRLPKTSQCDGRAGVLAGAGCGVRNVADRICTEGFPPTLPVSSASATQFALSCAVPPRGMKRIPTTKKESVLGRIRPTVYNNGPQASFRLGASGHGGRD